MHRICDTSDFAETLDLVRLTREQVIEIYKAGGVRKDDGSWEGSFIVKLLDGRFAYIKSWCSRAGWGDKDKVSIQYGQSEEFRFCKNHREVDLGQFKKWLENSSDPYEFSTKTANDAESANRQASGL